MFTKLFSHIKPLKFGKEKPPLKTTADPVIQAITQDTSSTPDAEALGSSLAAQHHHHHRRAATSKAVPLSPCRTTHEGTKPLRGGDCCCAGSKAAGWHSSLTGSWNGYGIHAQLHLARASAEQGSTAESRKKQYWKARTAGSCFCAQLLQVAHMPASDRLLNNFSRL